MTLKVKKQLPGKNSQNLFFHKAKNSQSLFFTRPHKTRIPIGFGNYPIEQVPFWWLWQSNLLIFRIRLLILSSIIFILLMDNIQRHVDIYIFYTLRISYIIYNISYTIYSIWVDMNTEYPTSSHVTITTGNMDDLGFLERQLSCDGVALHFQCGTASGHSYCNLGYSRCHLKNNG